jgi:hypothetical protein
MTHLHYDHAGAVADFPQRDVRRRRREWRAARSGGFTKGYAHKLIDHAVRLARVDFDDRAVASFASFGRTVDLFGDGSVRLLSTPGHTKGHMACCCACSSGRELLLHRDAALLAATIARSSCRSSVMTCTATCARCARSGATSSHAAAEVCGHDPSAGRRVRTPTE